MAQKSPSGTHLAFDEFTKTSLTKSIFQAGLFLQGASEIFEIGDDGGVEGGDFHPIWNVHHVARDAAKPLTALDTLDQIVAITRGLVGKRLRYKDLVKYNPPRQLEGLSDVF